MFQVFLFSNGTFALSVRLRAFSRIHFHLQPKQKRNFTRSTRKTIAQLVVYSYCHYCLCYFLAAVLAYLWMLLLVFNIAHCTHTLSFYCCSDFSLLNFCIGFSDCTICYASAFLFFVLFRFGWVITIKHSTLYLSFCP